MPTTTPYEISPEVARFAATICESSPEYVEVANEREPLDCFFNCAAEVTENGGELILGWAIWERAGAYLEAEHHAIVKRLDGTLMDVTPHNGETHILFLADPTAKFNGIVGRNNHRAPIAPEAVEWKTLANENGERLRKAKMYGISKITETQRQETMRVAERLMKVQNEIETKYPGEPIYRR